LILYLKKIVFKEYNLLNQIKNEQILQ